MAKLSRADIESAYRVDDVVKRVKKPGDRKPPMELSKPSTGAVVHKTPSGKDVHIWTDALDSAAWKQAVSFAELPFIHSHGLALMPDVHPGQGVPVGSVLPTVNALVPSAVGVDIGCGMIATRLNLSVHELPSNLKPMRLAIEQRIPVDKIGHHKVAPDVSHRAWNGELHQGAMWLLEKHPKAYIGNKGPNHLGTLGGGNHFVEVCVDRENAVWVMLYSGSRGVGAAVGRYFIEAAHKRVKENG